MVASLLRLSVTRTDEGGRLSCHASNTNLTVAQSSSLTVTLQLPPRSVQLAGQEVRLLVGRAKTVECVVEGGRPRPTITWLLASKPWPGLPQVMNSLESSYIIHPTYAMSTDN